MTVIAKRRATYDDVLAAPPNVVAEIVYGVLESHPRPAPRHSRSSARLTTRLGAPYEDGLGGPGGWIFMIEPELHFGEHVVVPDLAGWRAERLPSLPETPYLTLPPDWVCEIVSPSTVRLDRGPKRRVYAEAGVGHFWLLDPIERYLEAFALVSGRWLLLATIGAGEEVRVPPFDAVGFPLDDLFPFPPSTP